MTQAGGRPVSGDWPYHLAAAAACAILGIGVHLAGPVVPPPLVTLTLGAGLVGAAFMLAWAADAGEAVFSGGLVLASVALVTVLPELVIEIRFAYIQATDLVTANLTGATRLLLIGAAALPLAVAALARRRGQAAPPVVLSPNRRLELGVLMVVALFAVQIVVRGSLTVLDAVVLLALYVLYARRVRGTPDEEPAVVGVAAGLLALPEGSRRPAISGLIVFSAGVVLLIANPFADALLLTGTALGFDPYLLIQSVVPLATEAPEYVVVGVLVANQRPAQGLAVFLAASVSQWTLGMGALPISYLAGGGGASMPLAARERLELSLTIAVTFFVVATLATLRPDRPDALLAVGAYAVNLIHPTVVVRFATTFVLLVFAIDLLVARRRDVRPLLRACLGRRRVPK